MFDTRARRDFDRALLQRMNDSQAHRGPDGEGLHLEPGVALGHRRLSIIDIATGQQPLYNEDAARSSLFSMARSTISGTDSRNYRRSGTYSIRAAIPKSSSMPGRHGASAAWISFRGMFAFALFDRNRETLFLARDRLGVKPLYYAVLPDGTLLFGSELKSLLVHPGLGRAIDPCAVEEYLALGYVAEPRIDFHQYEEVAAQRIASQSSAASVSPSQLSTGMFASPYRARSRSRMPVRNSIGGWRNQFGSA